VNKNQHKRVIILSLSNAGLCLNLLPTFTHTSFGACLLVEVAVYCTGRDNLTSKLASRFSSDKFA